MMMLQQHEAGVKPPPDEASAPMLPSAKLADRRHKGSSGSSNADQAQKCPRCDSLNTKFCYYNNYSLSQPRHFCKNCRRYWTKGGALRNVPVGGGCRKNKRVKQRSMDPTSLASLDDSASNILVNISSSGGPGANGATSLLPNFSGGPPSSSAFGELSNENHPTFGLTFSRLQESMRIGEHSGAVPSSQSNLFSLGPAPPSLSASLLSGQPPPILGTMPPFHPPTYPGLNFDPPPQVKTEPGALLFPGSDLNSYLMDTSQAPHPVSLVTSAPIIPKLEDHLSAFSSSTAESSSLERYHHNALALHVGHEFPQAPNVAEDAASHGCNGNGPGFAEAETSDGTIINQRGIKGKPAGSSTVDWPQGASENMFGSASEASLWTASWPEMHAALAGSTMAGALLH